MMVTKGLMMVNSDEPRLIVANTAITVIAVNHFSGVVENSLLSLLTVGSVSFSCYQWSDGQVVKSKFKFTLASIFRYYLPNYSVLLRSYKVPR